MARFPIADFAVDAFGNVLGGDQYELRVYEDLTDTLATVHLHPTSAEVLAQPFRPNPDVETKVRVAPLATATTLEVDSTTGFARGQIIAVDGGGQRKYRVVKTVTDADTLELDDQIGFAFPVGSIVGGNELTGLFQCFVEDTKNYSWTVKDTATGKEGPRTFVKMKVDATSWQEEGATVAARTTANFIGTGVTAADNAGQSRVDITHSDLPGHGGTITDAQHGARTVASAHRVEDIVGDDARKWAFLL